VKTLFSQKYFKTLTKATLKSFTRLITVVAVLPLLLLSSFTIAKDISRSNVSEIKINLGEKIAFHSDNLKEQREFFIRLPEGYQENKRNYPVIYLLDANNETLTYMKDLYFHSVTQIERLMQQDDIPESIIVGIPFKRNQWFSNVSSNPKPFTNYLTKELSSYINENYRTTNNNILIGQSYSALFVINALPRTSDTFNSYVAIDPILANGELEKAIKSYQNVSTKNSDLQIIMGGGVFQSEAKRLQQKLVNLAGKSITVTLDIFPKESHGSVYYPALNSGLRSHFKDYRKPNKEQILTGNFNHQSLINYFNGRSEKYQVETSEKQFQFAVYDTIFHQVMAKKFEQAFTLWPVWKSQYKMYNANIITNIFLGNNDRASAISFLKHVAIAMPTSVRSVDRLATLYQKDQQLEQASKSRLEVKKRLTDIFNKPISAKQEDSLNRYGYSLLNEERNQEAITILKRITQAKSDSTNAHDSLAEAYELVKDYPKAIKALEKAITMANNKDDVNTVSFQQRLSRLQNIDKQ
jgi:predicted alpha/beta superfamily hydrolase